MRLSIEHADNNPDLVSVNHVNRGDSCLHIVGTWRKSASVGRPAVALASPKSNIFGAPGVRSHRREGVPQSCCNTRIHVANAVELLAFFVANR